MSTGGEDRDGVRDEEPGGAGGGPRSAAARDPDRRRRSARIIRPFQNFFRLEASSGILLLACAAVAFTWANGPWAASYHQLWETKLTVGVGGATLSKSLHHWINDGLMALFFLLVGLEIKRELLVGELSSPARAALPVAGALGGMVAPALVFVGLNVGLESIRGWAIPMATDIAFALGVLAILGPRIPSGLKVFLAALAIADDLGAVLVIALFYASNVSGSALAVAAVLFLVLLAMNRAGVRSLGLYLLLGVGLWLAVLHSGIHATVAGVLLAAAVPARRRIDVPAFVERLRVMVGVLEARASEQPPAPDVVSARAGEVGATPPVRDPTPPARHDVHGSEVMDVVYSLEVACQEVDTPLARLEHSLHPWSGYLIMPLFALANAGVPVEAASVSNLLSPAGLGVILGLFLGKQIGVTGFTWVASRLTPGTLPAGVGWRQVHAVSCLCGIGFTMSLFITGLAFEPSPLADGVRLAILAGSLISGLLGWLLLRGTR